MTVVTDVDMPEVDYSTAGFGSQDYHQALAQARARSWIAHSPLAYLVLDRESADFFLRCRQAAFPGRQLAEIFGITSGPLWDSIDNNILNLTGDRHRRIRSLAGHAFTPRVADRWRPAMRELLSQLWAEMTADGQSSADFAAAFARHYPSRLIAAVLGAPAGDAPQLFEWAHLIQRQFDVQALSGQVPALERAAAQAYD